MVTLNSPISRHHPLTLPVPTPAAQTTPQPAAQVSAFAGLLSTPAPVPAAGTASPAPAAAPTAESVFGSNPWMTNPSGHGSNGLTYNYNPIYFATANTAAQIAQMVGGKVVQTCPFSGGPFSQNQPSEMVQLPNGGIINPGLVASFYTHGYPQSYVNMLVANEVTGTSAT